MESMDNIVCRQIERGTESSPKQTGGSGRIQPARQAGRCDKMVEALVSSSLLLRKHAGFRSSTLLHLVREVFPSCLAMSAKTRENKQRLVGATFASLSRASCFEEAHRLRTSADFSKARTKPLNRGWQASSQPRLLSCKASLFLKIRWAH